MVYGKYTYGKPKVFSWGEKAKLKIGNFCSIGKGCNIYLGGNHRTDWVTTYPFGHINKDKFNNFNGKGHPKTNGNVIIKNDVWLGHNTTIMSGVTIGNGAVIANNSHVVKDVDDYSIVGGNPAKLIRYRFNEDQIKNLLLIKWWDWNDKKINEYSPLLCNNDIDKFIEKALLNI